MDELACSLDLATVERLLERLLRSPDRRARLAVGCALEELFDHLGPAPDDLLALLRPLLADPDRAVRRIATEVKRHLERPPGRYLRRT